MQTSNKTMGRPSKRTPEEYKQMYTDKLARMARQTCMGKVKKYLCELKTNPPTYRIHKVKSIIENAINKLQTKWGAHQFIITDLIEGKDISVDNKHLKAKVLTEITCLIHTRMDSIEGDINTALLTLARECKLAIKNIQIENASDKSTYYYDLFNKYFPQFESTPIDESGNSSDSSVENSQ
jgi:hypothetical protein